LLSLFSAVELWGEDCWTIHSGIVKDMKDRIKHSFMTEEAFEKIQERSYILENDVIVLFLAAKMKEDETVMLEAGFEIFGKEKQNMKVVNLGGGNEHLKLAQKLGIDPASCPAAVYFPKWLTMKESISTQSFQVTRDVDFAQEHLIQWIWHHMDIKGYIVFKSHTNQTVDVFWNDPIHKREWPSFTLKPRSSEKRNVVLGHQFQIRKRVGREVMEVKYVVRTTEGFVDVGDRQIHWYEGWAEDPDHPDKSAITEPGAQSTGADKIIGHALTKGVARFRRRMGRHFRYHIHGNPALFLQAMLGSMVGVMMISMFIVSTIVRFMALLREAQGRQRRVFIMKSHGF